ncbi:hypothetical protein Bca4012_018999 [Brassica carinata]
MGSFPALMITLASSLLFFLQTLEVVNGVKCYGSLASNRSYAQNRRGLFSTLASNVVTNGGFYNASLGQYPNKVYVLGLCARGYEQRDCSSCVEKLTLETQTNCGSIMDSFIWGSDVGQRVFCVVRSSNHSFGNLELSPPVIGASLNHFAQPINMTLFMQQWEYTVNKTLKAATKADTSSVHKYYSAVHAEFTEFQNVYMMMQCTPDITSHDCKQCLGDCVKYFREQFRGKTGGMASFPSCLFRWDLYPFQVAFGDVTRVPALSLPQAPEKGRFIPDKKGKANEEMYGLSEPQLPIHFEKRSLAIAQILQAWKRWVEGRPEFIIDPLLVEKPSNEIIKLIQIGLLCAQQNPTKRPTMSTVIVWLGSEAITIPLPKAPAFTVSHSHSEDVTTSMSNLYTELSCR